MSYSVFIISLCIIIIPILGAKKLTRGDVKGLDGTYRFSDSQVDLFFLMDSI